MTPPVSIQIPLWLMHPDAWRFIGFVSSIVGLVCYACSTSFNYLFGKWNLTKLLVYIVLSVIICLATLFANVWQHSPSLHFKTHMAFLVLTITSVYSFFFDKAVNGRPDAYSPVSCVAFAMMWLGLSRQIHWGFEVDLLYFFLSALIVQLMKMHKLLGIVGICFSYSLVILRSSLNAAREKDYLERQDQNYLAIQMDSLQSTSDNNARIRRRNKRSTYQKRANFEPTRKFNNMKIYLAQLEWYKKDSRNRNVGYYDSYKKMRLTIDHDVVVFHKKLSQYWESMVEEAEMKPQEEGAAFRAHWLEDGTNYRRMVEPLDIAEYYRIGGKDYVNKGRSRHFIRLQNWLGEGTTTTNLSNSTIPRDVESILTFDSCFWAHVEEALLSCKLVDDEQSSAAQKEEAIQKLLEFEDYVYRLLKNYEVSSEIFLKGSSYMLWWEEYKKTVRTSHNSKLASFMSSADNYNVHYIRGTYNFS